MTGASPPVQNVGIHAIQLYFPKNVVNQEELEKSDNVSSGKYTIGLGQSEMSFCGDQEDVVSLALTVTHQLLQTYKIETSSIGFLAVGTETMIDKSKSVKTELMELFGDNTDIEGVDEKNACFGGTQTLFHAVDWIKANYDGKMAIAVMTDIAVYEEGPARCTGGAGAIAVLIGPDAPIAFEHRMRGTFMARAWDFYKPIKSKLTEYPMVDGATSLQSYLNALENCYRTYKAKSLRILKKDASLSSFSAAMFHSPFTRMVQKAVARLHYVDEMEATEPNSVKEYFKSNGVSLSLDDREVTKFLVTSSKSHWSSLTEPYIAINKRIGNSYTSSLFLQLVCWLSKSERNVGEDRRILMFSYGSGVSASMFSVTVTHDESRLADLRRVCDECMERLDERTTFSPEEYKKVMKMREEFLHVDVPAVPAALDGNHKELTLFPGTFYLDSIDEKWRRHYSYYLPIANGNGIINGTNHH